MNQSQWDEKLKSFLKKTGEDVKRAGNDIKAEAERLLKDVQDPERQAKLKAGMKDFGGWARKTAEEMAELMETGVKRAEVALSRATDKVVDFAVSQKSALKPTPGATPVPPASVDGPSASAEARAAAAPPVPPKRAKKSIGGARRKSGARKAPAKKSIGKPPRPGGNSDG